ESPERVVEETERLREAPLVALRDLREAASPVDGLRGLLATMLRSAYGLEAPPAGETSRLDLRSLGAGTRLLDELEEWQRTGGTRAVVRLSRVREAATDDGSPREASPFWHETAAVFDPDEVARATTRRPLSQLTWPLDGAPTERERVRSLARLVADSDQSDLAFALADANGWSRRLARARRAF